MLLKIRKGQSTAEYAILIGVVIGALVAMQVYVRRSLQAKAKYVVDLPGELALTGVNGSNASQMLLQFEPGYAIPTSGTTNTTVSGSLTTKYNPSDGYVSGATSFSSNMTGNQTVGGIRDYYQAR